MPSFVVPPVVNTPDKIQLQSISHVYLEHANISQFAKFAGDFGFVEAGRHADSIYYRGFGTDPYAYVAIKSGSGINAFHGAAFTAQSELDYLKATRIPGAVLHDLSEAPGGGHSVEILSPGGSKIHIIWGQERRETPVRSETATTISSGRYNTTLEKFRKGEFQRFKQGPALIHKLGHYGFITPKFDEEIHFYTSNFNFVPSDILHAPGNDDVDVLTFMHLDLGMEYSDHHSIFFQRAPSDTEGAMHHCSFEVDDFDTQLIGHEFLLAKGYTPVWGVGRHILGSQIFDYWKDSSGFTMEHYADGDVVNRDTETVRQEAGPHTLSIWGPALPRTFTE